MASQNVRIIYYLIGFLLVGVGGWYLYNYLNPTEKVTLAIDPVQCEANPWNEREFAEAETETEKVKVYLSETHQINTNDITQETVIEFTCQACSCPRGDRITVIVDQDEAAKLLEEGWRIIEDENDVCTENCQE